MGIRKLKNITEMGKEMDCKLLGIRTGIKKVRSITKMGKMDQEPFGLKYKNKTTKASTKANWEETLASTPKGSWSRNSHDSWISTTTRDITNP